MDEIFELKGISFVWDSAKVRKNLLKHGVSFEQAVEVFFDPFLRVIDASPDDEIRDAVIGMDEHWNLFIRRSYCFRNRQYKDHISSQGNSG